MSFGDFKHYFDPFYRHPFSMMMHRSAGFRALLQFAGMSPSVDFFEEGGDMVVKADIPGTGKVDLNVSITGNSLTISGEKKQEE